MFVWLRLLCYLLLFTLYGPIQAADKLSVGSNNVTNSGNQSIHWQAKWLWGVQEHPMQLFRRSFAIKGKPSNATLYITASSLYQLYVNGIYIARGPARSAPHHQSYDTWQLNHLLTEGENVIAVKVHSQKSLPSYQHQTRGGLLAQLTLQTEDEKTLIISDENWLTNVDESWDKDESRMSRFHHQVNDKVDLAKSIKDKSMNHWFEIDFNDNNWSKARVLMRNVGWPRLAKNAKATSYTAPWTQLVARDIPHLIENKVRAKQLVTAVHTDNYLYTGRKFPNKLAQIPRVNLSNKVDKHIKSQLNNWRDGEAIILPKSDVPWLLLFDFGQVRNGMAYLKIKGSKGSKVEIISKPFMLNDEFSYHTIDSNLIDQVLLSGEDDVWQATYFKPTRYLALIVKTNEQPVQLDELGIHEISYPFKLQGKITSKQAPWIQQFMQASAKTIKAATTDAFTDNYRERRQYSQTGFYAALGNYYLFADTYLQKRYLMQVAQEQYANGLMPAYAPQMNDSFMVILDSNLLWLSSLHSYLLYSGDVATVKQLLPAAEKLLLLLANYTNEDGMLDQPPFAYWLDHAVNDRRGANLTLNGHYLNAIENYAEILDWLGRSGAECYRQQGQKIRHAIKEKFWHQHSGLFVDALIQGQQSSMFSEHGNAMVLALNIASKKQANQVIKHLLKDDNNNLIKRANGMTVVSPAMSYYLHKGIANYGFIDESFALLNQRFSPMLAPQYNGTLWEEWWLNGTGRSGKFVDNGRTRSDVQTESAFAPALFAEYILGVRPIEFGMKTLLIKRMPHSIKDISGLVPTPFGLVKVEWQNNANNHGKLKVDIPKNIELVIDLSMMNSKQGELKKLTAGQHTVNF